MKEHDILLGRDYWSDGYRKFGGTENVGVYASTRKGKTSGFTIPNSFAWPGSLVVLDIKREAFNATAGYRQAMGQDVYLFDPAAEDRRSHRWDPFAGVWREGDDRFGQISRIAHQLFPEPQLGRGSDNTKHWEDLSRNAFIAVATLLAETPKEDMTISNIRRIFTRGDEGMGWLSRTLIERRKSRRPYSREVADGITDYVQSDIRTVSSIRTGVSGRLGLWADPQVTAVTATSDFSLSDLRRRPMTIYVAVNLGDIPRMAPLLRLFFHQLITSNTDRTPSQDHDIRSQTLVLLDEFARLGRMDSLAHAAATISGYGMRVAYIVQNKAQIRELYGEHGASDIFDNLGAEIIFGTGDHALALDVEKRLGDNTVNVITKNRPSWFPSFKLSRQTDAEHPHRRPLLLAQEVLQMPPDEMILIRPGMVGPGQLRKIRWWLDRSFTSCRKPIPIIPELDVQIFHDDAPPEVPPRKPPVRVSSHTTPVSAE